MTRSFLRRSVVEALEHVAPIDRDHLRGSGSFSRNTVAVITLVMLAIER